jgi:hypothetical protein
LAADVTSVAKMRFNTDRTPRDEVLMPSNTPRVPGARLRRRIAVGLLAATVGLAGTPVGNVFVDQAAAGKKKDGGSVSAYGKKVRR